MSNITYFRLNNIPRRTYTFELGKDYQVSGFKTHICRFIKVTPKGFNLLRLDTSRCFLKKHLYAKAWSGKSIPNHETRFKVKIPNWITIKEMEQEGVA